MKVTLTSEMMRETATVPDNNLMGILTPPVQHIPLKGKGELIKEALLHPEESPDDEAI